MKSLFTFVGNNDMYPFDKPGAILTLLAARKYDRLFLFLNNESYLKPASEINRFCKEHYPEIEVRYIDCPAADPTDYNLVYPGMYKSVNDIKKEFSGDNFTISVTSGTPTMHACWIFLVQGGVIEAEMVQVARDGKISPISFELDDFPQIKKVSEVKAELTRLARENKHLRESLGEDTSGFIGECEEIIEVKSTIKKIAPTDLSVLISGNSGTGKEEVAKSIHLQSFRRDKPFLTVSCGAIPGQLFESELFGYVRGAFTGASSDKEGILSSANGGTVFLDEIGELSLDQQVKLLRAIDYQKFLPVGSTKELKVNVRFISATNRNLNEMVAARTFREDLYFRINQIELFLPPLATRGNDKIILALKFVENLNKKMNMRKTLADTTLDLIERYPWPGNIRELKNVIEVGYLLSGEEILLENMRLSGKSQMGKRISIPDEGIDLNNEILPSYYSAALKKANGNAAEAARLLSLEPHTFRARLKNCKNIDLEK